MNQREPLKSITIDLEIFGGKPIIRGRRPAAEQALGMPAAGDGFETSRAASLAGAGGCLGLSGLSPPAPRPRAGRSRREGNGGVKLLLDTRVWGGASREQAQ